MRIEHGGFQESGIENARRIALAELPFNANTFASLVAEGFFWIVASGTRNGSIQGKSSVKKELAAESNFLGILRVV
jgi:hypothetical protein